MEIVMHQKEHTATERLCSRTETERTNLSLAQELCRLIPDSARRILHLGCGPGRLGRLIGAGRGAKTVGIERDKARAARARRLLQSVIEGDVEQVALDFPPASFDCALCSILTRLKDPWRLLARVQPCLRPEGRLVVGAPNLRHHLAIATLLDGDWSGTSIPALAPEQLRFFTRREMEKMVFRAGFEITETRAVPGPGYESWANAGRRGEVSVGRFHVGGLSPEQAEEFYASHFLLSAVPRTVPPDLTSIIILTHNQLAYTQRCVESIARYTDNPYELIFVDNASTDGTVEYLRGISSAKVILNSENRGFPAGVNQGIAVARGEHILLMNNDCVVTTGWLDRLLRALYSNPEVGMVGPCSNNVSGEQQVTVAYDDLSCLDGFAWDYGRANDRRYVQTDRLVGFCLLMKREAVDKIGPLDERFGIGCYEDDDYCRRAVQAGYRLLIAFDAFVHHFGSRTFVGSGTDLGEVLRHGEKLFREKWAGQEQDNSPSTSPSPSRPPVAWEIDSGREDGLLLRAKPINLSLCMIVRDNASTIAACLDSIKPWVDEMVVVDTGSRDNTPELCRERGARLFHFPWCDDFSAARNESFRHARGEWIFWMDSDDTIGEKSGRKLRELAIGASDPSILGYVMQVHCPGGGEEGRTDVTVVDHVKLIRNRPGLRFEHRIHEQILPAIRRAGGEVAFTDIFVVHSGADHTPKGRERKLKRDFHLLHLDLKDRPDHPFVLFNLGMTHGDAGQHEEAIRALRRSIEVSQPAESHVRKAYALIIGSYCQLGRYSEAWDACRQGREHFPNDIELLFREGILHHHFHRLSQAAEAYRRVLKPAAERHFTSVDSGISGFKARHNLALVYEDIGQFSAAEEQWRQVVAEAPSYRLGWRGLGEVLLRQQKWEAVAEVAHRLLGGKQLPPLLHMEGMMLQGHLAEAQGAIPEAGRFFQNAVERWPEDLDARHALCRFLFERGRPAEAKQAIEDLLKRTPDDAAAYQNLGAICSQMDQHGEAVEAFRRSLRFRPDWPVTYLHLARALEACGRTTEAVWAWRGVLRLEPSHPAATQALRRGESGSSGKNNGRDSDGEPDLSVMHRQEPPESDRPGPTLVAGSA
jgi:GT2 family glycosyltransferase/tetratricopeptide (TPR) repeat protein/SAM-dependent methyltransferase